MFGHGAGDLLLIEAARADAPAIGPGEFLARQSGDEFLALQTSGNHPHDAQAFAERIAQAFAKPFAVRASPSRLTASIGFSVFPTDTRGTRPAAQQRQAGDAPGQDRAARLDLHVQPRDGRHGAGAAGAGARSADAATARNELVLHYQLQTSLQDGRICGAEALMRWHHPKRGMISPAEFIPLAEETEAIVAMGEWALRTACRDAAAGRIPGTVAVNLSPVQFGRDDLAEIIHAILLETGLSPSASRSRSPNRPSCPTSARGLHVLRKLKAMGITVAMDDFGTGYSSLATLHAFPFDKIKLDQSFVKRLPNDAAAAAIVRTVLALGDSLGMPVLAEGIETEAQWQFLAREGCAKGQGYLFAKPVQVANCRPRSARPIRPRHRRRHASEFRRKAGAI